jgi:hypothetical protein
MVLLQLVVVLILVVEPRPPQVRVEGGGGSAPPPLHRLSVILLLVSCLYNWVLWQAVLHRTQAARQWWKPIQLLIGQAMRRMYRR